MTTTQESGRLGGRVAWQNKLKKYGKDGIKKVMSELGKKGGLAKKKNYDKKLIQNHR